MQLSQNSLSQNREKSKLPPPAVSVVIPAYNGARYIGQAITSLFKQSQTPAEIIVVDDGSSDDTVAVVAAMQDGSPCPLHLIQQPNAGTQTARNTGLQHVTSPYIVLLDQDDWLEPNFLAETLAHVAPNTVVFSNYRMVDANGVPNGRIVRPILQQFEFPRILLGNEMAASAALLPTDKLKTLGGFDAMFLASGDWDMWIRLRLIGAKFIHLDKPLANYRLHPANTSKNLRLMLNDHRGVVLKTLARSDLPPAVEQYRSKILAADYLYAATRLWRTYQQQKEAALAGEIADELRQALKLYPAPAFWPVVFGSLAANSGGDVAAAINFALQIILENTLPSQVQTARALAALTITRYQKPLTQALHQNWRQILKGSPGLAMPLSRAAFRRLQGKTWLE